jgi:hypothetical protein
MPPPNGGLDGNAIDAMRRTAAITSAQAWHVEQTFALRGRPLSWARQTPMRDRVTKVVA